jgi:hypothetical protein
LGKAGEGEGGNWRNSRKNRVKLNSLSSHNHLVSLDSRSSGIHQHRCSDDSLYADNNVVNMADNDDSDIDSDDSEVEDHKIKLEFKSADFFEGNLPWSIFKTAKQKKCWWYRNTVPVNVDKVSEKPGVEIIKIENERIINLHWQNTGFDTTTHDKHADVNIYDKVSFSHQVK